MSGDVYVTFGGDTSELEASLATAKAGVNALSAELRDLAKEMQATGASADSELGQHVLAVAQELTQAKAAVSGFKSELKEGAGGNSFAGLTQQLQSMIAPIGNIKAAAGELVEAFAAAFAVEKIASFIEGVVELGEQASRTAAMLGISTGSVSALDAEARASGSTLDDLSHALERLGLNLQKGQAGSKEVGAALTALGLSARQVLDLPLQDRLAILADRFAVIHDGIDKDAIAMALFGKAGADMIPFLNRGAEGIAEFNEMTARAGSDILPPLAAQLEQTGREALEMSKAWEGLSLALYSEFRAPIDGVIQLVNDLTESITQSINKGGEWKNILDLVKNGFQLLESAIVLAIAGIKSIAPEGVVAGEILNVAFRTFGNVVRDVFSALAAAVPSFFSALETAGSEAAHSLAMQFSALGTGLGDLFKGDLAGMKAAFGSIDAEASSSGEKIKAAFKGVFDFSAVSEDMAKAKLAIAMIGESQPMNEIIENGRVAAGELEKIWTDEAAKEVKIRQTTNAHLNLPNPGAAKAAQDALAAAMEADQSEVRSATETANAKIALYQKEAQAKQITEGQMLTMSLDALQDELQDQEDALNRELQLQGLRPQQRQKILDQIRELEQKNADDVAKIQEQAAAKANESWNSAMNSINSAFTSQISGLIKGTTSFKQAFTNVLESLTERVIKFFVDWGLQIVESQAKQLLGIGAVQSAQEAADAAKVASGTAANATVATSGLAGIAQTLAQDAAKVFGGIFAFLSPILGPAAAAPAAAGAAAVSAAGGGIGMMDIGAYNLPSDQLAMVHKSELIMPAAQASAFRNLLEGGAASGPTAANVGFSPQFHFNGPIIGTQAWINQMMPQLARALKSYQGLNPSVA